MRLGGNCDTDGKCDCITFTYDGDASGGTAATEPSGVSDVFGFRYGNNAIKMLRSRAAPPSCSDPNPSLQWEAITDETVDVTKLTFQYESRAGLAGSTSVILPLALNLYYPQYNVPNACTCGSDPCPCGCPYDSTDPNVVEDCLQMRTVIVTISGRLERDHNTTMSIRERVKIPNDRYCTEDDGSGHGNPSC